MSKSVLKVSIPSTITDMSESKSATIADQFDIIISKINDQILYMKSLAIEIKNLKKETIKSTKKPKKIRDPSKPPPFTKPVLISEALRSFINHTGDISRTDVTKKMYSYIKENNLQNPNQKRQFIVDKPLATLLEIDENTSMEYFKLQKFMSIHYPKIS